MNHLFLGLGGMGVRVWQAIERRLSDRTEKLKAGVWSGDGGQTAVEAVVLDTDPKALRDEAPGWSCLGQRAPLPSAQRVLLEADVAAVTQCLQARTDLHSSLAPEGQDWSVRLAQLGPLSGPLSTVAARLPGWPSRRVGRLLLAVNQNRVRYGLEAAVQALQSRSALSQPLTLHVVAHVGGATGAGVLVDVLELLRRHPLAARCAVRVYLELPDHDTTGSATSLVEVQAYAVLRELQALSAQGAFQCCYLGGMTDERGLQPLTAVEREQRLAQWVYHQMTGLPLYDSSQPLGTFAAYGLAERGVDRLAVRTHLSHELMLRLLAQLRYNHWRPGLGFVAHPRVLSMDNLPELMSAWGLSDAHLQLALPLPEIDGESLPTLSIEQEWQMLSDHYAGLVQLVPPSRRVSELRRLFEQGVTERFRGHGVDAAFDLPDHLVRRRAVVVRQRVEGQLWDDWRQGRRSLHECGQLLAAVLADLAGRIEPLRQEQHAQDTQAMALLQQVEAKEHSGSRTLGASLGLLLGGARDRERALAEATELLREQAMARTRSAVVAFSLRLLAEVQSQLTLLQGMIDSGEVAVATLAEETDTLATAALPPVNASETSARLDTRELLAHWRTQLVVRESVQREHLRVLRQELFTRLGEQASFRVFAQRIDEAETCDALLAACARRLPLSAIRPVVSAGWDAWVMRFHNEPEWMARELSALRVQSAVGLAWGEQAGSTLPRVTECLRLPARPEPPPPVVLTEDGEGEGLERDAEAAETLALQGEDMTTAQGDTEVMERVSTAPVAAAPAPVLLPNVADLLRKVGQAPLTVQEQAEDQGELALLRQVCGVSLAALPRVQELHRLFEAYRLQAGRAALWLQLDDGAALPELLAPDVEAQMARARTVVLMAEAFGLLREEAHPVTGQPMLMHVRLDADGFELDRVRLGSGLVDAVDNARDCVLHDLADEVHAALAQNRMNSPEAQHALRDAMRQRIESLRQQAEPLQRDRVSRDWNEAARAAMKLARQEGQR